MQLKRLVEQALQEDVGDGDRTTELVIHPDSKGKAVIKSKETGVLAGGEVAKAVFTTLDSDIKFNQVIKEGERFASGIILFEIEGKVSTILKGERVALNFLQHLSGVATLTNKFVKEVRGKVKILDTRKTTPGLRELEKYAVRCGGGENHRMGLWDSLVLIKDNHIKVAGGIKEAVSRCKMQDARCKIEVEVKDLEELEVVLNYPIDRVMLDNMSISDIKEAVSRCKMQDARSKRQEARGKRQEVRSKIEVSGGVNLENVREIAETGVDYISVGALTHSVASIDMSLEILSITN